MQFLRNRAPIWITTKFLLFFYILFNVWFITKWRLSADHLTMSSLFLHVLSIILIFLYSEGINNFIKRNWIRISLSIFLITTYYLGGMYHYRLKQSFDYALFIDNIAEMFSTEAFASVTGTFKPKDLYQTFSLVPILIFLQYKFKVFSRKTGSVKLGASALVSYFIILSIMPYPFSELSYTVKSAIDFHFGSYPTGKKYEQMLNDKPYVRTLSSKNEKRNPHIFVLALESFSSHYVEKKARNGKEFTPVFNSLIKEGLYIEDFYGSTVQTIKGHYSLLCGRTPLIRTKASYKADFSKFDCLPSILKKYGYDTQFHQSYIDIKFDNTSVMMKNAGIDTLQTSKYNKLTKKQLEKNIWAWGMQDNLSYVQYLDNVEELIKKNGKPVFSLFASISHHMKFKDVPKHQWRLYNNIQHKREYFENSLNVADGYLQTFIDELKKRNLYENSIIVITGDHSFPNGQHGYYDNQTNYYEEFFKVPLLIIDKKNIKPRRISKKTFSQRDVPATILDMIGFKGEVNLPGKSILNNESQYAYLVQPYNGMFLSVVKYPYKYVWQKRNGTDFIHNLEKDPNEKVKIYDESLLNDFRKQRDVIFYDYTSSLKK